MMNLEKLADYAKDKSPSGRRNLVGLLTEFFLEAGAERSEQISLLFGDVVLRVIDELDVETRITLAESVCQEKDTPHELMVKLAQDEITVAKNVLKNSNVLTSDDLVSIASSGSAGHLEAIAERAFLDGAVSVVLADKANAGTLIRVVENRVAVIPDAAFLKIVEKAQADETLRSALINRTDLPEEAGRKLLPMLSDSQKQHVSTLGAENPMVRVIADHAQFEDAALARKLELAREQANALIQDVVSGQVDINDPVRQFSRSDRIAELGMLFAKVSDLHPAAVSQLLFSKSDKSLVILCKACGVNDEAYKDVLTMRARRQPSFGLELNDAIQRFAKMTVEEAVRSLQELKESGEAFGLKLNTPAPEPEKEKPKKDIAFAVHR
ncbi:MAG: DUF2336 domain-containing protein [Roseibium sp.]